MGVLSWSPLSQMVSLRCQIGVSVLLLPTLRHSAQGVLSLLNSLPKEAPVQTRLYISLPSGRHWLPSHTSPLFFLLKSPGSAIVGVSTGSEEAGKFTSQR